MDEYFPYVPNVPMNDLKITDEGRYSVTKPRMFEAFLQLLKPLLPPLDTLTVLDCTANNGGDTLGWAPLVKQVIALEWNPDNCAVLRHNVRTYGYENVEVHCTNSTETWSRYKADVMLIDPPWGGPSYKTRKVLDLWMGSKRLDEWVREIVQRRGWKPRFIAVKLPFNYNWKRLVDLPHRVWKWRNTVLVFIQTDPSNQ